MGKIEGEPLKLTAGAQTQKLVKMKRDDFGIWGVRAQSPLWYTESSRELLCVTQKMSADKKMRNFFH